MIATRIMAERTSASGFHEEAAFLAHDDALTEVEQRLSQLPCPARAATQQPQHGALGAARAKTGQRLHLEDEFADRGGVIQRHRFRFTVSGFGFSVWSIFAIQP